MYASSNGQIKVSGRWHVTLKGTPILFEARLRIASSVEGLKIDNEIKVTPEEKH
jgi:hypothetical protein